jgi:hypothetical protein
MLASYGSTSGPRHLFHYLRLQDARYQFATEIIGAAAVPDLSSIQRFTAMGVRGQLRAELNVVRSNPFFRAGAWMQRRLRGRSIPPPRQSRPEDFEFAPGARPQDIDTEGTSGPFVLLAVGRV